MASFELIRSIPIKTPTECFNIACEVYPQIGFTIWKKREIGWLVLAKKRESDIEIDSNFSARPGAATAVTLIVTSPKATQEELEVIANEFMKMFNERI